MSYCGSKEKWVDSFYVFTMIDTLQTMVIPFFMISISNVMIMLKLVQKFENKFNFKKKAKASSNFNIMLIELNEVSKKPSIEINNDQLITATSRHNVKLNNSEAIRILFIITTTFLVLNFPLAITKTYHFFQKNNSPALFKNETILSSMVSKEINSSSEAYYMHRQNKFDSDIRSLNLNNSKINTLDDLIDNINIKIDTLDDLIDDIEFEESLTKISYFIYYINFSINFFLYSFNTNQFWQNFLKIFHR
jgi:hypothetical protein